MSASKEQNFAFASKTIAKLFNLIKNQDIYQWTLRNPKIDIKQVLMVNKNPLIELIVKFLICENGWSILHRILELSSFVLVKSQFLGLSQVFCAPDVSFDY